MINLVCGGGVSFSSSFMLIYLFNFGGNINIGSHCSTSMGCLGGSS